MIFYICKFSAQIWELIYSLSMREYLGGGIYWDPQEKVEKTQGVMIKLDCQVDKIRNHHADKAQRKVSEEFSVLELRRSPTVTW